MMAGCARPQAVVLPPVADSGTLGTGDVLTLAVVGEEKLPTEYTVAPDGSIDVPYVHRVHVAGLEPQQVSALVRERLMTGGFLRDPSVTVQVKAFNSKRVVVSGEVKSAGSFSYEPGMTLQSAIAKACGTTSIARTGRVVLVRATGRGQSRAVTVDLDAITVNDIPDVPLQPGDRIMVPQRVN
jgi:protein involved in polysaccharide export with SLBB domain